MQKPAEKIVKSSAMLRDETFYLFGKMLEGLPGKPDEIAVDLRVLLKDCHGEVSHERQSHLLQIRGYLEDNKLKGLMREAIEKRLAILNDPLWPKLPGDIVTHLFTFFSLTHDFNKYRLLSKQSKAAADKPAYWQKKLIEEFEIEENLAKALVRPDVAYKRGKMLRRSLLSESRQQLGSEILFHCLDEKNDQEMARDLGERIEKIPNKSRLAQLGSLRLIRFLIRDKKLSPDGETLGRAARSGSLPLVRYLVEDERLRPDARTLTLAAASGSLPLVRYLVEDKQLRDFGLSCRF